MPHFFQLYGRHTFELLQKHLLPYHEAVRANDSGRPVYVVEDDLRSYGTARRLLKHEKERRDVKFITPPANSADLILSSRCYSHEYRLLGPYEQQVNSHSTISE